MPFSVPAASVPLNHGGDRIAEALFAHGTRCLYTLCGGHISPILAGAKARGIRIVDVRDEATAVFAADAAARLTGAPGVAAVTAGPGITNTITALKNAQLAHSPVILIGGAAPTALQGRGALQDIDQRPLVEPHVKQFIKLRRVIDLMPAVSQAFERARSGVPGPVFIECPVDLLYEPAAIREWYEQAAGKGKSLPDRALRWYLNRHVRRMLAGIETPQTVTVNDVPTPKPSETALSATRKLLARAERPLLIIGSQALVEGGQTRRAQDLADAVRKLGVPVYLSGMARGLLGRDDALQMRHARREALREADCVLLAGVPCDFRLDYGRHIRRSAKLIAVNRSAREARLNRRPDVAAIGDVATFIETLSATAPTAERAGWLEVLRRRDQARELEIDQQAAMPGEYVNPIALLRRLEREAGDQALFVADGGDFVATASYVLHPRAPLTWLDPGAFGTLGVGAGFALGAVTQRPDREVWMVLGDGACGFGLVEFDTFVRHGIPVIAIVGNDAGWTQIAREQVKMLHDDVATTLARSDYHLAVQGLGAVGLLVRQMNEMEPAFRQALELARAGNAVLVNVWLDKTAFREGSLSM